MSASLHSNLHVNTIFKQAFSASAVTTGEAITGLGTVMFDMQSLSTESSVLKNFSGNGVKVDACEIVFACTANCGSSGTVAFQVQETDTAAPASGLPASGSNISGAAVTISEANKNKIGVIRLRLDRGTVTKRYIGLTIDVGAAAAAEVAAIAIIIPGSAQLPITQDLAAVSVE